MDSFLLLLWYIPIKVSLQLSLDFPSAQVRVIVVCVLSLR